MTLNQEITKADIDANKLRFTPALNANGEDNASFEFKVSDGTVYSDSAYTIVYDVTAVNDAPVLTTPSAGSYTDTSANDTFTNTTGTLSASDIDTGTTLTYGISSGTNGSTTINSVTYDISKVGTYGTLYVKSSDGSYVYVPNASAINALTANDTDTFTVNTSDSSLSDSKTFTVNITGVNDTPTVSLENIDVTISFGSDYTKNISTLFDDIDNSDVFTFEAINLPAGLSIDPVTGIISGKPTQSGNFIITIRGTDSGTPTLSVDRTYNMLVLAPAQIVVETPVNNVPTGNNNPVENNTNITLNTFTDNPNSGVLNFSTSEGNINSTGEGFIGNRNTPDNTPQNNTENPTNNSTNNGRGIIQSNIDLNVSTNGQISFNQGNQDSFSVVGITIEDIKVDNGRLEIKVVDTNQSQNFIVTQIDGSSLPKGLFFDPKTGSISGTIPENMEKLEISIKSVNTDGTTKILNLKLDLKQLNNKNQADIQNFIGLKEQIALENQKLDGYGTYLTKLFA